MAKNKKAANKPNGGKKAANQDKAAGPGEAKAADKSAAKIEKAMSVSPELLKAIADIAKRAGGDKNIHDRIVMECNGFGEAHALALRAREEAAEWNESRENTKRLKKVYDGTVEQMQKVLLGQEPGLPFDPPLAPLSAANPDGAKPPAAASAAASKSQEEAFKAAIAAVTLDQLGISKQWAEALAADGIKTGAEIQKWRAEHPPRKIKGITEEGGTKIGDALADWSIRWIAANPPKAASAVAPPIAKPNEGIATARNALESKIEEVALTAGGEDGKSGAMALIGKFLTGSADPGTAIDQAPIGLLQTWFNKLFTITEAELAKIVAGRGAGPSSKDEKADSIRRALDKEILERAASVTRNDPSRTVHCETLVRIHLTGEIDADHATAEINAADAGKLKNWIDALAAMTDAKILALLPPEAKGKAA